MRKGGCNGSSKTLHGDIQSKAIAIIVLLKYSSNRYYIIGTDRRIGKCYGKAQFLNHEG